jgi:hypothetical protein
MASITLMLMSGLAAAGSANGGDHEVSLELGSLGSRDESWSIFSDYDQLGSVGGRVGYALGPRWSVLGDYQVGRYGESLVSEPEDYSDDYEYSEAGLDITIHQLSIGPKYDVMVKHWLRPYATVQGLGLMGRLRLTEDDEDPTRYSDIAPGGLAALGVDLVPGRKRRSVHAASHLELGYARAFALNFEDRDAGNEPVAIGDLKLGGLYVRWGVGIRF